MDSGRAVLAVDPSQLSGGDGLPQNGHDYLKLVQAEREKYPSYAFDSSSSEEDEEDVDDQEDEEEDEEDEDEHKEEEKVDNLPATPSTKEEQFRYEIVQNFCNLRKKIETARESIPAQICDNGVQRSKSSLHKLIELGHPPQLSAIIHKSQLELHRTLEVLADQCQIVPDSPIIHTDWIYSLMAALWEPIERDIHSTLRRLTKICICRRDCLEAKGELDDAVENEEYASCLLIICIVRFYFGQADLK